jgi:hypothetical protein
MKQRHRGVRVSELIKRAQQHDRAADALSQAATRFHRQGEGATASLALKSCYLHRIKAIEVRAQAGTLWFD